MNSGAYLDIRNSAVEQIKQKLAGLSLHIEAHPGTFSEEEIRRLVTRTPAILTALLRITDRDETDESWCDFVSWVLYRASNQDALYDGALGIISALIPVIRGMDAAWSIDGGTGIEASTLYTGSLDKMNVTLWAVRWRWQVRGAGLGGEIPIPEGLEYFEGYEAAHVVGENTANDTVNLEVH